VLGVNFGLKIEIMAGLTAVESDRRTLIINVASHLAEVIYGIQSRE
jgi:hypothetical protein